MTHDVLGCIERSGGPRSRSIQTDGNFTVLHLSCHCGREHIQVTGEDWRPKSVAYAAPLCPSCEKPVHKDRGFAIDGVLAHGQCANYPGVLWAEERKQEFVNDYNSRVPLQTIIVRYELTSNSIWKLTKQLRLQGYPIKYRKTSDNKGNRTRRRPTEMIRQRHQSALAGIAAG